MKKLLLSLTGIIMSFLVTAQVSFIVLDPSPNAGSKSIVDVAEASLGWTAVPDMNDPVNAITGKMVMVKDKSVTADSLACDTLINGNDIAGNIAVLYRFGCDFSEKAYFAKQAGAIGVIIINYKADNNIRMRAANYADSIDIPVILISMDLGATLKNEILAGNTSCFIGNKVGYLNDDITIEGKDVLRARQFATPSDFAKDDTEFSIDLGSWVYNLGKNDQTNVMLSCEITGPGVTTPFKVDGLPVNILSNDSAFISLPSFSQTSYPEAYYNMVYTVTSDAKDEFELDNSVVADFMITKNDYSVGRLDSATGESRVTTYLNTGSVFTSSHSTCIRFSNANASRRAVTGLTFEVASNTTVVDEVISIEAYTWEDDVKDPDDPDFSMAELPDIAVREFVLSDTNQERTPLTVLFEEAILLEDDVDYFFCVSGYSRDIFVGHDDGIDYKTNVADYAEIVSILNDDAENIYRLGFGTDVMPAIKVKTIPLGALGLEEDKNVKEIKSYPNPAIDQVTVLLNGMSGKVILNIVDVNGKLVSQQSASINNNKLIVDVSEISSGMYVFNLNLENGNSTSLNIVITK